jgi:hypothetical protein
MANGSTLGRLSRITCVAMSWANGCTPAPETATDVLQAADTSEPSPAAAPPVEIGKRDVPSAPAKVASALGSTSSG